MAETSVQRIDKAQWQRNLKNLLQHFFRFDLTAILTIQEHIISAFGGFVPDRRYDFCFPHKEILKWFQHQICSSRLQMPLPQKDRNWAGFVMCASFQVHEHPTVTLEYFGSKIFVSLLCHFKIQDRSPVPASFQISKEKFKWFYTRGFIWMTYMPRRGCADILNNEATSVEVSFHCPDCPSLTVEKCGIRLLYQHEVEEFKQTIIEYTTSFFDDLTPILDYIADENEKKYGGTSGTDNSHNSESRVMLDFHRDFRYNSCYPHLNIYWFSHPNIGPSVTIHHLPPRLESDDNWIGLALFACFSNLDDPQPTTFGDHLLTSQLQTERGSLEPFFYQTDHEEFKWLNHGGQFFWLSYLPKKWFLGNLNQCSSLEASFVSNNQSLCVKMCGLHLVYWHDEDDFRQTIMDCVGSLFINQGQPNDSKDKVNLTPILDYIADENEKKYGGTSGKSENPFLGTHQGRIESRELLDFHRDFRYNSCYPHLDKDWFSHPSSEPSVTIQHLPPCLERDDNWIGLALFACFSNLDDLQPTTFVDHHLICQLQTERSSLEPFLFYQTDNEEFKWLNHGGQFFWLSYVPKKWFLGNLNQCNSLEASFVSDNQRLCVKMCGLHLVYRHDEDDFKQTILACVDSLFKNQWQPNNSKDKGKQIIG